MSMGKTGTIRITPEMMTSALKAVEDFRTTSDDINKKLASTLTELFANFEGSAADGFSNFNTEKIQPLIGTGLTQMLDALKSICEGILKAIPDADGIDDQLGKENSK